MAQNPSKILPNGDVPTRSPRKSYMDKHGPNPMENSFDNCYVRSILGRDPLSNRPITVWDEQINREQQIMESIGEKILIFRMDQTTSASVNGGQRYCLCWDKVREMARSNCPLCNGMGIAVQDPNITRIAGYEWLQNPDENDRMWWVRNNMIPGQFESRDRGLYQVQENHWQMVPTRNASGNIVNIIYTRDVFIRFLFNLATNQPIRELGRYEMKNVSYAMGPSNQILHFEWDSEQAQPSDSRIYALPNFLT